MRLFCGVNVFYVTDVIDVADVTAVDGERGDGPPVTGMLNLLWIG